MIGRLLAHYRIVEKLGEGGMGVVYKARDTHLDRFVAIKVLPPEKVTDPGRKARFFQEAKAASALNHPNIVTVHDVSEADGVTFIVMECVEGKTLDQLLARKGLKLNDVLRCAIQVAGALSKAHKAGIVHRDLKPSNVMATGDGVVKVLDFGLAKLTEPAVESDAETTATIAGDARPRTAEGQLLGTIAYMSPEQAEARAVDGRSDIFSFGALLYEMATGQRAFQGDSKVSILAAILREDPKPASSISGQVPREFEKIIARCLRKDAARRYQNMDDVRLALEELKEESESGALDAPASSAPRRTRRLALAGVAMALLVAAATAWYWLARRAPLPQPELVRLTADSGLATDPALSPDGRLLAYASDRAGEGHLDIWVQQLAGGEPVRITHEPADDHEPHFSFDGTQIAFRSDRAGGGVYMVSALGGDARLIANEGRRPRFSPDGMHIAFWKGNPTSGSPWLPGAASIWIASVNGGAPRQIAAESAIAANPEWTPDGKHLVFVSLQKFSPEPLKELDFWVAPVNGGPAVRTGVREAAEKQSLRFTGNYPALAGGGGNSYYLPLSQGDNVNLWRVALSPRTWRVDGALRPVSQGAETHARPSAAGKHIAFAATSRSLHIWGMKLDANRGRAEGEPQQITHGANCYIPTLSADGSKMGFVSVRSGGQRAVVRDLASGREVVVANSDFVHHPVISLDGSKVAYRTVADAGAADTFAARVSGGIPEKVCTDCGMLHQWSKDGNRILYSHGGGIGLLDIPAKTQRVLYERPSGRMIWQVQFSPDERWISFIVNVESTRKSLHIAPASGGVPPENWITVAPAECENDKPRWSPDGSLLYFTSNRDGARCVWAQRLDAATKRPVGDPFAVFHSHSASRSLGNVPLYPLEMAVAPGRLVFVLGEVRANIWMTQVR